jgi:hypothetical protein
LFFKDLPKNLLSPTCSRYIANMAGKKTGEQNTKKVAGNAKKAEAAAAKAAAENAKKAVEEEQDWSKGAKSNAKK